MRHSGFILAVFAVVLARLAAAGEQGGTFRNPADYFPADTILYVEIPSVSDFIESAKGTGVYGLWQDNSMSAIRAQFEGEKEAAGGEGGATETVRWAKDFVNSIPAGVAFGLIPSPAGVQWLVLVEVGPDDSAARAFLDKVYAREASLGTPAEETEIAGFKARVSPVEGECGAIAEGMLVLGTKEAVTTVLRRISADSNAPALSTSVNFTKSVSFLSPRPAYRMVLDAPALLAQLKNAASSETQADIDRLSDLFGVSEIDTVSLEGSFRLSGVIERVYVSTKSADARFIELVGRPVFDEKRLVAVPREAVLCGGRASDPKAAYDMWKTVSAGLASHLGIDIGNALDSVQEKSGVSIERDVLPAIGPMNLFYVRIPEGGPSALLPSAAGLEQVTLFEVTDEKALNSAIDKLVEYVELNPDSLEILAPPGGGKPPTVETATLGTIKLRYLSIKGAAFYSPALAVSNGYLIYASNKETVKTVIDNLIAPGPSILDIEDYARVRGALAKDAVQLAYVSLDRLVDLFYDYAVPALSQRLDSRHMAGKGELTGADIPPAYIVKRYIDGIGASVVTTGNLVDTRIYSPTGFVPLGAPLVFFAATGAGEAAARQSAEWEVEVVAPRARLQKIGQILQVSTVETKGRFPDKITDVISAQLLQAPQDPAPESPVDYEYVPGYTTSSPGRRVLVYERKGLNPDGRYVLFVDGSVEFISEGDFEALMGEKSE